jgi:hypothetical protein
MKIFHQQKWGLAVEQREALEFYAADIRMQNHAELIYDG